MSKQYYRCTTKSIPENQSSLKNSTIPLFFSINFQNDDGDVPLVSDSLVRCEKCKAYLNPYVEVIMPGLKWKCNLCHNINTVDEAFKMLNRSLNESPSDPIKNFEFNSSHFLREDLKSEIYEIEAPDSFVVKTPDPPILCFLIEISSESHRLSLLPSIFQCIKELIKTLDFDPRTKLAFVFFDENCYILNNNLSITLVSGEIPMVLADKMLFSLPKNSDSIEKASFSNINFENIENYFENKRSAKSNLLLPLKVVIQAFRSASILTFVSSMPNISISLLKPSQSLVCTNSEYKIVAESLYRKNMCFNLFVMTRSNIELASLSILSQHTGGRLFHYSNYDGCDPVFISKLYADLNEYFASGIGFGAVCRIRANEGVLLKNIYGNFCQKGSDIIGMANFNPVHALNFSLSIFSDIERALYVQIAMIRVTKAGSKLIRVFNICVPVTKQPFYSSCDINAINQSLVLESLSKNNREDFINKQLELIWRELKSNNGTVPEDFRNLPQLILASRKSIAIRPDNNTPTDFKALYMYYLSNMHFKMFDLIIYPILINISDAEFTPLPLRINTINPSSFYLLDTGITLFFYAGKNCDRELFEHLFGDSKSGPLLFNPSESEFSKYIIDVIMFLQAERKIKPRYVLIDDKENTVYSDIFFSCMVDDRMFNLPGIDEYNQKISSIFQ